jgi:hypothetical protein
MDQISFGSGAKIGKGRVEIVLVKKKFFCPLNLRLKTPTLKMGKNL